MITAKGLCNRRQHFLKEIFALEQWLEDAKVVIFNPSVDINMNCMNSSYENKYMGKNIRD